jgi:hypothetical protein
MRLLPVAADPEERGRLRALPDSLERALQAHAEGVSAVVEPRERGRQVQLGLSRAHGRRPRVSQSAGSATRLCDSRRDPGCHSRRFSRSWGGRNPATGAGSRPSTVAQSLCRLATVRAGRHQTRSPWKSALLRSATGFTHPTGIPEDCPGDDAHAFCCSLAEGGAGRQSPSRENEGRLEGAPLHASFRRTATEWDPRSCLRRCRCCRTSPGSPAAAPA